MNSNEAVSLIGFMQLTQSKRQRLTASSNVRWYLADISIAANARFAPEAVGRKYLLGESQSAQPV